MKYYTKIQLTDDDDDDDDDNDESIMESNNPYVIHTIPYHKENSRPGLPLDLSKDHVLVWCMKEKEKNEKTQQCLTMLMDLIRTKRKTKRWKTIRKEYVDHNSFLSEPQLQTVRSHCNRMKDEKKDAESCIFIPLLNAALEYLRETKTIENFIKDQKNLYFFVRQRTIADNVMMYNVSYLF